MSGPALDEGLRQFSRNIVLRAGAGTGKTDALTRVYLYWLAGMAEGRSPTEPGRIIALTFTEKAAAEMRARIRRVLDLLCVVDASSEGGREAAIAAEIHAALRARGLEPRREAMRWRRALDRAPIQTLHGFCAALLREYALVCGIDPSFAILPEERSRLLRLEAVRAALVDAIERNEEGLQACLRDIGGIGRGSDKGLARLLASLLAELPGEAEGSEVWSRAQRFLQDRELEAYAQLGVSGAASEIETLWFRLLDAHEALGDYPEAKKATSSHRKVAERAKELRDKSARFPRTLDEVVRGVDALEEVLGKNKAAECEPAASLRRALREHWSIPRLRQRTEALASVCAEAIRLYEALKSREGCLDFNDLVQRARDLLRDRPEIRERVQSRFEALLVDEFQDTDALQRDLIYLLRALPAQGVGVPPATALERRGLLVVGDRKQSIYSFRGADVEVFESVASDLLRAGAWELSLRTNYRSLRPLVQATNRLAAALLASAEGPGQVRYDADREDLEGQRSPVAETQACVEWLQTEAAGKVEAEASAIARRVFALCAEGAESLVHEGETTRRAGYGDIALLLPTFTHLATYLQALEKQGIPARVVNDQGLLERNEAYDMLALAALLLHDDEGRATLALLRSPLLGCDDRELASLVQTMGVPSPEKWNELATRLSAPLRSRWEILGRLRALRDQVPLARLCQRAVEELGYLAVLATLPGGAERVANVERLLEVIAALEAEGYLGLSALDELRRRQAEGVRQAQAPTARSALDALSIMTVHQSKGLQFPIVFAAGLDAWRPRREASIHFFRHSPLGISLKLRKASGAWQSHFSEHLAAYRAAIEGERQRLLYVQMTRAEDYLVLVARAEGPFAKGQRSVLQRLEEEGLLRQSPPPLADPCPEEMPRPRSPLREIDPDELARCAAPTQIRRHSLELAVTHLEEFSLCPRRYRARYRLRIDERPDAPREAAVTSEASSEIDPRKRGTLLHRLLEDLDFALAHEEPEAALRESCMRLEQPWTPMILERLESFLRGAFVARCVAQGLRLRREVPLAWRLRLEGGQLLLRGQVDLLVEDRGHVLLIDYKTSSPRGADPLAPYRFQLSTYALALRAHFGDDVPLRAGVQFLDGRQSSPMLEEVGDWQNLEQALGRVAGDLQEAQREGKYAGRPLSHCDAIRCGYRWICHPAAGRAAEEI